MGYVTVRGCAPISELWDQSGGGGLLSGTYWKSGDSMSLCNTQLCNTSSSLKVVRLVRCKIKG